MKKWIKTLSELSKLRISLLVTLSTATGFILAADGLLKEIVFPLLGVFLLACGSSSLNQFQERKTDAMMQRTRLRPIPSGRLHPSYVLVISLFLILLGSLVLFYGTSFMTLGLGIFSILWYNGIYTNLKRKTAFAIIPGAIIGAIPPMIGWTGGGGGIFDPQILAIAFFFFVWQIPHFWLLLLSYGNDYEKAGLPSLTKIFTEKQLSRITFIWILATMVTCLSLSLFSIVTSFTINLFLLFSVLWLGWSATKLLRQERKAFSFNFAFKEINLYAFFVISLLPLDRLLNFINM